MTSTMPRGALRPLLTAMLLALAAIVAPAANATAVTPTQGDESERQFGDVMQQRGDTAVPVKFVMSMSGAGSERQQEGQTQGTMVSADGLILVPGRVVSLDLSSLGRSDTSGSLGGATPTLKSGQFRVRLAGSDEWIPADLVTRDTELGIAWLRLRNPHGKLPFVDFGDAAKVGVGTALYTVMRTSDQFGNVPVVRAGYVLGETTVPRHTFLVDGAPGLAFDGEGHPAGFADVDLNGILRSRGASGGIGMDFGDMVFSMIPADRLARVTAQAAKLPVVKSTDSDDAEAPSDDDPAPAPAKPAAPAPDAGKAQPDAAQPDQAKPPAH